MAAGVEVRGTAACCCCRRFFSRSCKNCLVDLSCWLRAAVLAAAGGLLALALVLIASPAKALPTSSFTTASMLTAAAAAGGCLEDGGLDSRLSGEEWRDFGLELLPLLTRLMPSYSVCGVDDENVSFVRLMGVIK